MTRAPPSPTDSPLLRSPPPQGAAPALAEFLPLLPAETHLLQAAREGAIAKIGFQRPRSALPSVRVRAKFLAWLACGGSAEAPVAGGRLQLLGACIVGTLDLVETVVPGSLWLYRCVLVHAPQLTGAHIRGSLSFPDSGLPGLQADGCRIDGELALNAGCNVYGELRLTRAAVGLDLNCERMQLQPSVKFGYALPCRLSADGLQVGGSVRLGGGVEAAGELSFRSARIAGDFDAGGARLNADLDAGGARGLALCLVRASVGGNVLLNAGFSAAGQVDLQRAHIGGDLDCDSAGFDAVGDAGWSGVAALTLERARIGGTLALRRLQAPLQGASLRDARALTLADDASTWGRDHRLDGFAYQRLAPGSSVDAGMRLGWLERQHPSAFGTEFQSDPWHRVVKVLRRAQQPYAASEVAIGHERHLRRAGRIGNGAPVLLRGAMRAAHAAYGLAAGYGHRPLRMLALLLLLWWCCGGLYWAAASAGAMAPIGPRFPPFHPFVFSLDLLLPGLDLGQVRHWIPAARSSLGAGTGAGAGIGTHTIGIARGVAALMGLEAVCGWLAALTAVVALTGATGREARA